MNRRGSKRSKRRLTCEFEVDGRRHRGIIRDVSESGLFIQTTAQVTPGRLIDVRIIGSSGVPDMGLRAVVARLYQAPPELATVTAAGIGVQILEAPAVYRTAVVTRAAARRPRGGRPAGSAGAAGRPRSFHVRVTQSEGTRSRTLEVRAPSEEAARKEALARIGEGWEVLEIIARDRPSPG